MCFIKYLHMQIGWQGGLALAQALGTNDRLSSLNLAGNCTGESGDQLSVGTAFADALVLNRALCSIDLSSNRLGPAAGVSLARALTRNNALSSVNFANNRFDQVSALKCDWKVYTTS
jgi:hypothetical protein